MVDHASLPAREYNAKRRSPVVARFEIVSDDPAAGEAYKNTVTVQKSGRVLLVVECTEREETVQEWCSDHTPTLENLVDLLLKACRDDYHKSRVRLLSAVVYGLLPQGNYLLKETSGIPDAILDASLGFGPRTTYRAEIQKTLLAALRSKPETAWALRISTKGTDEHDEFSRQLKEATTADPEWVQRVIKSAQGVSGTSFDDLVVVTLGTAGGTVFS